MSYANFVQCQIVLPLAAGADTITLVAPSEPYQLPPEDGGILVIADSPSRPSHVEVIRYLGRIGLALNGVERGQEGTTARDWTGVAFIYQPLTAGGLAALIDAKANADDPRLTDEREWAAATVTQAEAEAGTATTRRAWTAQRVRQAILAGWAAASTAWGRNFVTSADATAGRTALGLDAASLAAEVRSVELTGYSVGTSAALAAADTVLAAFGKVQAQLNTLSSSKLNATATAAAATKLATARTINGVAFDGTGDITVADSTKLPLTGGALTGNLEVRKDNPVIWLVHTTTGISRAVVNTSYGIGFTNNVGGFAFYTDDAGNAVATGNVTAYSDLSLKTNIQVIPDALEKVASLRGVTFERIDTGLRQTGVIAQEVQAVLPEAVTTNGEYLSVAYGNLVGLLIEAIKELKGRVEELEHAAP